MNKRSQLLSLLIVAAVCGSVWIWGAGCDMTAIDEGADATLPELLSGVSAAKTQPEAQKEIRKLLNKTQVGVRWRPSLEPGPYDSYVLDDAALASVAKAQAGFNAGDRQQGTTARHLYEQLLAAHEVATRLSREAVFEFTPPAITASLDEVLQSFHVLSRQAVSDPERPENALLLAIVADGAVLPDSLEDVPVITPDHVFSPVQRLLFGVWLHQYGPSLPLYVEEAEGSEKSETYYGSCPDGTDLCAKFQWNGYHKRYDFVGPDGKKGTLTITGDSKGGSWTSTVDIDRIILKGDWDTDVILTGGARSGTFSNANFAKKNWTKPPIKTVQFCSGGKKLTFDKCKLTCLAKGVLCVLCGGGNCEQEYKQCLDGCHDQGGGG